MRVARLQLAAGRCAYAELDGTAATLLSAAPWCGGERTGERLEGFDADGRGARGRRMAPLEPSKIVCVGRNYRAHAAELGNAVPSEPLLFLKPPSSLLGPDGKIELPPSALSQQIEHEVELGLVMGARARRIDEQQAAATIWGHTIVGDITARDLQRRDKQWTRAKGFDTFCPVGPVVVSGLDASALAIGCEVSGEPRQTGSTADMVVSPAALVAYISQVMTLEPGDLVATGTPAGVGLLVAGDQLTLRIEGIGTLQLGVVAARLAGGRPPGPG